MTEDTLLPFDLPTVRRKKVTADFEGGLISSDGGLVLLRGAERRLGLAERLAGCIRDWRDPALVVHTLPAMLRFRMFAIACGYEDADDCDALRTDPLFKLAVGQSPESGRALCSQPTMSRLENAPSRLEVARMTAALVDIFCRSFAVPPRMNDEARRQRKAELRRHDGENRALNMTVAIEEGMNLPEPAEGVGESDQLVIVVLIGLIEQ